MAVTLSTTLRNTICTAVTAAIDGGSGPGKLVMQTSGDVTVATLTFADPSFGSPDTGVATANSVVSDTNAAGGTIAKFKITDSNGTTVLNGSVGLVGSGADMEISNVIIGAGDTVAVSWLTYTAPVGS